MKKAIVFLLSFSLLGLYPTFAHADCPGISAFFLRPHAPSQFGTVSGTAVGLTLPTSPSGQIRMAVVSIETNSIRFRDDGTNPSASVGVLVQPNAAILVCGGALTSFKMIRTGSDAGFSATFYGD